MPERSRLTNFRRGAWRWLRAPCWLGLGVLVGFGTPYVWVLNQRVIQRVDDLVLSVPTRVYAQPLVLAPGVPMNADTLALELQAAAYRKVDNAHVPGTWSGGGARFVIASRGFAGPAGGELPRRVQVDLARGQVAGIKDLTSGKPLHHYRLDPARIATVYGAKQEDRQIIELQQAPPLLVTGLQAVEDRDFKHHHGIDFKGIARAAWADLRAGHVVQGGSTLTQQLVRNLFLDRNQTIVRKLNEALLAELIEFHYNKAQILGTYINEVFLGQRGQGGALANSTSHLAGRSPAANGRSPFGYWRGTIHGAGRRPSHPWLVVRPLRMATGHSVGLTPRFRGCISPRRSLGFRVAARGVRAGGCSAANGWNCPAPNQPVASRALIVACACLLRRPGRSALGQLGVMETAYEAGSIRETDRYALALAVVVPAVSWVCGWRSLPGRSAAHRRKQYGG